MTAIKMDGRKVADDFYNTLKDQIEQLKSRGVVPGLAVISACDDAGKVYIQSKQRACEKLGIHFEYMDVTNFTESDLAAHIMMLNARSDIHGIIIQSPLKTLIPCDWQRLVNLIDPMKDVDGLGREQIGNLWTRDTYHYTDMRPCTPQGIMILLKTYLGDISGKHVVILGRSDLVGKPLAKMLLERNCTVTICHSHTELLNYHIGAADILITAMGKPGVIDWVPYGIEALVDVSINRDQDGHLVGDVPKYLYDHFKYYTPVPGGVGPMTVACLMSNVVGAAYEQCC